MQLVSVDWASCHIQELAKTPDKEIHRDADGLANRGKGANLHPRGPQENAVGRTPRSRVMTVQLQVNGGRKEQAQGLAA